MGDHRNFSDNLIPESPKSEQFWLPSVSVATEDLVSDVDRDDDITVARYATPEDCNLRMDDDTPLCSVCCIILSKIVISVYY